ncbi:MAG: hypothetical protein WDA59_00530 [Methanofastidiosum sp.]|nr:hypothetical protein [Candidatus Izemoplasmatales bacterium]
MAKKLYYSDVDEVIKYTGVEYDKLGLGSEEELEELILKWLKQVTSLMNNNRNRNMITDLDFGDKVIIDYGVELWKALSGGITASIITAKDEMPDYYTYAINQIEIDSSVTNMIIVERNIDSLFQDFSDAKILMIRVKPYLDLLAGDMQLILSNEEEIRILDFPEMNKEEWKLCKFYLGCDDDLKEITKISIKVVNSIGSYLWISDVQKLVIPEGIINIAMRACANMVKLAYANRESPVIRIEDLNATLLNDEILTDSLKKELKQWPAKPSFRFMRVESPND